MNVTLLFFLSPFTLQHTLTCIYPTGRACNTTAADAASHVLYIADDAVRLRQALGAEKSDPQGEEAVLSRIEVKYPTNAGEQVNPISSISIQPPLRYVRARVCGLCSVAYSVISNIRAHARPPLHPAFFLPSFFLFFMLTCHNVICHVVVDAVL